jgi:hypothetical protein
MKAGWIVAVVALAACSPQEIADKAVARTAQAVISPVVGPEAALCIVEAAEPGELQAIAVDYGVEAGTSTVANIMAIAKRPAAASCIAQAGITQLLR